MKKVKQTNKHDWLKISGYFGLGLLVGLVMLIGVARLTWHSKFYPGVSVGGVSLAGLTREQGQAMLTEAINKYRPVLSFNGTDWAVPESAIKYEVESSLNEAYSYGRRLKIADYLLLLINKQAPYPLILSEGKTEQMTGLIQEIANQIEIPPIVANIEVVGKKVQITNGRDGVLLSSSELDKRMNSTFIQLSNEKIVIPTMTVEQFLSEEEIEIIIARAEKLLDRSLALKLDDEKINFSSKELVAVLSTEKGGAIIDESKIEEYTQNLATNLNKDPQDAKFEYSEGKVQEFAPGKDGVEVNIQSTITNIQTGIEKLLQGENKSETAEIAAERTAPKVTTEKVNELGIKERIGRGESFYAHSIPNRIYNVALASSRLNSALVPPGEEISFNKLVGEVSGATGYRPAYIISGGRTILGDGGGLCQVSTTMFRAAMSAGLPILERWGHAYRVSYYELNSRPGVDATVIAPSKDFRFKNDTPGHILIQTINDPKELHLVIEIYGTSDGRVATMSEPKVWGNSPPLPTIYQDDPSLPAGVMKQVDWAASGAKASFDYKVVRNGEILQEKTFTTAYRPWAAVYLRGTGN